MSTSVGNAMGNLTDYTDTMAEKRKADSDLGMTDFLTMLVAQLQHQDPLNPMDSKDFTSQLTQMSQLEAQFKSNKFIEEIATNIKKQTGIDIESYLGKTVTASVDTIDVSDKVATKSYYSLKEGGNVTIKIFNSDGKEVRSLAIGQKGQGTYPLSWNGKDDAGKSVADGTYKYKVFMQGEQGLEPVYTSTTGEVESILHQGEKKYLVVKGALVGPDSVVEIKNTVETSFDPGPSIDYIGKEVKANVGLIYIKNGVVKSTLPSFKLDKKDNVKIGILDAAGNRVYSYYKTEIEKDTATQVEWNGKDDAGKAVPDGYYVYQVAASKGTTVDTSVEGEVTGVHYENNWHYLDIEGVRIVPDSLVSIGKKQ